MKTYLMPISFRIGSPSIIAIEQDKGLNNSCWLVVYHQLPRPSSATGYGKDYDCCSRSRISEECYQALKAEAKNNKAMYKHSRTLPA